MHVANSNGIAQISCNPEHIQEQIQEHQAGFLHQLTLAQPARVSKQ